MKIVRFASALVLAFATFAMTAQAQRTASTTVIHGTVHPQAVSAMDRGAVSGEMQLPEIQLYLAPTAAQLAALSQFLSDQRTPQTSSYHHWLTPSEFGSRFGISSADEAQLRSWLAAQGFSHVTLSASRTVLTFSGSAAQAVRAFNTSIHSVVRDGEQHYANLSDIAVSSSVAHLIQSVRGLDDFRPHSQASRPTARPQFTNANGYIGIAPGDIATIYDIQGLYSAGIDGTGITAAVLGQTDVNLSDITAYRNGFGLPTNTPTVVLDPASTDPGTDTQDLIEADMDLELLGAVARNATLIYVNSSNVYTSLQYAIDQNLAQVVSLSYGSCESNTTAYYQSLELLAQQANAQGMTLISSSGDTGAANCDSTSETAAQGGLAVASPASTPEFTGVGGTDFTSPDSSYFGGTNGSQGASALSYIPEVAWNTTSAMHYLMASGGGASAFFAKPAWQEGSGVPADGKRDVPDVAMYAMSASSAYIICTGGDCASGSPNFITSGELAGGTSAAAPVFAGIVTLLNNYLLTNSEIPTPGLGNINPHLYLLANNTSSVFHDITQGNNTVPCVANTTDCTTGSYGFEAGAGYDQVTGLGSVDAFNLLREWGNYSIASTSVALTSSNKSAKLGESITLTAKVTPSTGTTTPTGAVVFYDNGAVLSTVQLDASGTATLAIDTLSAGAHTLQVAYAGSVDFGQALSATLSQTILQLTTTTLMPSATQLTQGGSITLTATVVGANQVPTGKINYYSGTTLLGSAQLTNGSATLTTTSVPVGTDSLTASYSGDATFAGSSSNAVTVTVASVTVSTTTTLTASPIQAIQGSTVTLTASVSPATGTTAPTGTVSFYNGSTALGTASLSNGTATMSTTSLPLGTDSLTASYAGNAAFTGSASASVSVTVIAPILSTTTTLTASPTQASQGATVTLTASVAPATGTTQPTGTVSFYSGSTALGTASLSNGEATLSATSLPLGTDSLTASYAGASTFGASTSSAVTVTINQPLQPSFTLSASPSTLSVTGGQNATATLTITPANGFNQAIVFSCSGLPTGSTCTFGTPALQSNGTSTVSLSISTQTLSAAATQPFSSGAPLFAILPFVGLLSIRRRKAIVRAMQLGIVALAFITIGTGMIGCGGGNSAPTGTQPTNPTPVTSTVTVTATPTAGAAETTQLTLTVK